MDFWKEEEYLEFNSVVVISIETYLQHHNGIKIHSFGE
ncbi:hypothetical protein HBHAL_1656 [Halobacillus halophilus DSM 2266]|uniref:Uncharacterized protein n=1 Tax=Halobacillus halophilus (strain ATCC 35676 / DSM 2266 / JCM 20832 / KCTC 3685 / LMG 17431 / NBRC 102448 / NCIMB 2269) TaxID=866895 RepID=I0JIQ5_HALH3|nr:hypothetical protein HBHAL_1656 [Halobacillus halophilus DSM 2266]